LILHLFGKRDLRGIAHVPLPKAKDDEEYEADDCGRDRLSRTPGIEAGAIDDAEEEDRQAAGEEDEADPVNLFKLLPLGFAVGEAESVPWSVQLWRAGEGGS
jgi:hypothetical protein